MKQFDLEQAKLQALLAGAFSGPLLFSGSLVKVGPPEAQLSGASFRFRTTVEVRLDPLTVGDAQLQPMDVRGGWYKTSVDAAWEGTEEDYRVLAPGQSVVVRADSPRFERAWVSFSEPPVRFLQLDLDRGLVVVAVGARVESDTALTSIESVLEEILPAQLGIQYRPVRLVRLLDKFVSTCSRIGALLGPFYCPSDSTIYLDSSFHDELLTKFGSSAGPAAQTYVLAHMAGHHLQNLLGTTDRVQHEEAQQSVPVRRRLALRKELQADFYAGVCLHHANRRRLVFDEGNAEEALNVAATLGDNRLQGIENLRTGTAGEHFGHGSSAQRVAWFRHGLRTGLLNEGDTFDDAVFDRVTTR